MDDRLREIGGVPGYEFDVPRASGRPSPVVGGGGPPRQTWPREPGWDPAWPPQPPGEPSWPPRRPARYGPGAPKADSPARPGRPTLLARNTLAAMRARNWLTRLAVPLVA